jgi:hypothetical protein
MADIFKDINKKSDAHGIFQLRNWADEVQSLEGRLREEEERGVKAKINAVLYTLSVFKRHIQERKINNDAIKQVAKEIELLCGIYNIKDYPIIRDRLRSIRNLYRDKYRV